MKLPLLSAEGKEVGQITVDDSVFGIEPNPAVLHQAFVAQRANQRRGTASTKTRGEVQGSTRKTRAQKYTGRARQGGIRSPVRVGGGVAFGPRPRSYVQTLPKKMRRLAIRSALSGKVADGQLHVVDKLEFDRPRTKEMLKVLRGAGIERSALIITAGPDRPVLVSARNIQKTKVLPADYINVVDLIVHRDLLLTQEAVRRVESLWAVVRPKPAAEPPKPATARRRAAKAPEVASEATTKKAVAPKPRRARRAVAEEPALAAETPAETVTKEAAAPKPRRARPAAAEAPEAIEAEAAPPQAAAPEAKPKPRRTAKRPKAEAEPPKPEPKPKAAPRRRAAPKTEAEG